MPRKFARAAGIVTVGLIAATLGPTGAAQTGCAEATATPPTVVATSPASETPVSTATVEQPAWQTIALTDACTSESFTLGDFAGRTVYVEPMATWCPPCREQLDNVREAREQLGDDDFVFVALSVETDLAAEDLAEYAREAGFDWRFAVMTPEMLAAIVDAFGRTAIVPPSTPHFVIRPDGSTTDLRTGIEEPDALVETLTAVQAD